MGQERWDVHKHKEELRVVRSRLMTEINPYAPPMPEQPEFTGYLYSAVESLEELDAEATDYAADPDSKLGGRNSRLVEIHYWPIRDNPWHTILFRVEYCFVERDRPDNPLPLIIAIAEYA